LILHPVTGAFDDDGLGVVEQTVQNSRSDGAVVVENGGPLLEGLVGGENDGAALVALADNLEEQIGTVLVDREISHLVQGQEFRGQILLELTLEDAPLLGGGQVVDDADGIGKEYGVALLAGGIAQGGGQVRLPQSDSSQENDIGFLSDELQSEEVLHLETVDFLGPVPVELFEGFEDREAGGLDASFDDALAALGVLAFDQATQVLDVIPLPLGALLGQFGVVRLEVGQFEIIQMLTDKNLL